MINNLTKKHCVPCEGVADLISPQAVADYMKQLVLPWELEDGKRIKHTFKFKTFKDSIHFVNKVAGIAEQEAHHPDIHIYYNKVTIELWTHAIGGLFDNDFILASKIEKIM